VNTIDPGFFEANIPEAFRARKLAQAEAQDKMVDVLPFFHDLILHSNMISHGKCRPSRESWLVVESQLIAYVPDLTLQHRFTSTL